MLLLLLFSLLVLVAEEQNRCERSFIKASGRSLQMKRGCVLLLSAWNAFDTQALHPKPSIFQGLGLKDCGIQAWDVVSGKRLAWPV